MAVTYGISILDQTISPNSKIETITVGIMLCTGDEPVGRFTFRLPSIPISHNNTDFSL